MVPLSDLQIFVERRYTIGREVTVRIPSRRSGLILLIQAEAIAGGRGRKRAWRRLQSCLL